MKSFLYSCFLSPQGKFISDFFIFKKDETYLNRNEFYFLMKNYYSKT